MASVGSLLVSELILAKRLKRDNGGHPYPPSPMFVWVSHNQFTKKGQTYAQNPASIYNKVRRRSIGYLSYLSKIGTFTLRS